MTPEYLAEVGLVGKGPGLYSLYLGGSFAGDRLASKVLDNADEAAILETLSPLFARYSSERQSGERFGDFLLRTRSEAA